MAGISSTTFARSTTKSCSLSSSTLPSTGIRSTSSNFSTKVRCAQFAHAPPAVAAFHPAAPCHPPSVYSGLIPGVVTYISLDELCYRTLQRDKNGVPKQSKFCEEKHIGDVPTLTDERARKRDTNLCCSCLFSRHTHLSDGLGPRLKLSQVPADPAYFTTVSKKLGYRQADSKPGGADASANAAAIPLRMPNQLVHADGERCIAWQLVQAYFASRKVMCVSLVPRARSAHWDLINPPPPLFLISSQIFTKRT